MTIRGGKAYRQHTSFKEVIRERDHHTCLLCGAPGNQVDHIPPYAACNETRPDKVRVLCRVCNMATRRSPKNANPHVTLEDYYAYIEAELVRTR